MRSFNSVRLIASALLVAVFVYSFANGQGLGMDGARGPAGATGAPGATGVSGATGAPGATGVPGSPAPTCTPVAGNFINGLSSGCSFATPIPNNPSFVTNTLPVVVSTNSANTGSGNTSVVIPAPATITDGNALWMAINVNNVNSEVFTPVRMLEHCGSGDGGGDAAPLGCSTSGSTTAQIVLTFAAATAKTFNYQCF